MDRERLRLALQCMMGHAPSLDERKLLSDELTMTMNPLVLRDAIVNVVLEAMIPVEPVTERLGDAVV